MGVKISTAARIRAGGSVVAAMAALWCGGAAIAADDAQTYGETFNTPVFERIDSNSVDLVTGKLQLLSPVLVQGTDQARVTVGLRWTGQGWTMLDMPTIWRKGEVYTVVYNGSSEEFNDRDHNYSQRKPITGSKLGCSIYEPGNVAAECHYTNRNGDVIHFRGRITPSTPYPGNYGQSAYAMGNIAMTEAVLYSVDSGFTSHAQFFGGYTMYTSSMSPGTRRWGLAAIGGNLDQNYHKASYALKLGNQTLTIVTPNHDGTDTDEHFLRPKNTTQIITDDLGASWRYTINNDRELTLFDPPGNAASISYTYDSNHRVTSVTNADGVWTYAYTSPGDYGTTTVTNPLGEQIYVKYHRDRGYVTEARDGNYRTTLYEYDSGHRLTKVTFPELNYLQYVYDARGNITSETAMPKPGQGAPIVRTANFPATCTDQVLCNLPTWTRDGKGNQTDFEYAPTTTVLVQTHGTPISVASGTRKPVRILLPADANGIRPEIRNVYESGTLTRSAACRTTASCVGTADEVVTDYDYAGTAGHLRRLYGVAVTSEGVTLRTCYGYDQLSRLVSETPPNAEVASCPSSLATALVANAVVPTAAHPASPPTYPDGTTGGSPPAGGGGGGGDPGEPVEECMRPGSTVECQ